MNTSLFPERFVSVLHRAIQIGRGRTNRSSTPVRGARTQTAEVGGFAGHRGYVPGDDARRVDWSAYARSGELHLKTFEEEQGRELDVLLDQSASMAVGGRFDHARRGLALAAALRLGHGDRVQVCGSESGDSRIRPGVFEGTAGLRRLLEDLADRRPSAVTGAFDRRMLSGRGGLLWFSDFADLQEVERQLRSFGSARRRLLCVLPILDSDLGVEDDGVLSLFDPESGRRLRVRSDRQLRDRVAVELARLRGRRRELFARFGVQSLEWVPPNPAVSSSSAWLGGALLSRILSHAASR